MSDACLGLPAPDMRAMAHGSYEEREPRYVTAMIAWASPLIRAQDYTRPTMRAGCDTHEQQFPGFLSPKTREQWGARAMIHAR